MYLFIFALASVASAGNLPCKEPDTDHRLPSKCPPGQVLHSNVCRSYFHIRSQGKTCLLPENQLSLEKVPADEIICPLKEQTSDCNLYRARIAYCFHINRPAETQPPCKEYDAQGEYEKLKICPELTDGIPLSGFKYRNGFSHTVLYPAIVPVSLEGQCPIGYCPTNGDKCIRWGHKKDTLDVGFGPEVLGGADTTMTVVHPASANVTDAGNFRERLNCSQKVPHGTPAG